MPNVTPNFTVTYSDLEVGSTPQPMLGIDMFMPSEGLALFSWTLRRLFPTEKPFIVRMAS